MSGSMHGYHEQFIGIGIIIDTFKNVEIRNQKHHDVLVMINDGTRTSEEAGADVS
jgi:hypothetical protein